MKWSTLGLVAIGIVAALCAAILVVSLRARPMAAGAAVVEARPKEVKVCVAARALEPMTVVDSGSVMVRTLPASMAPEQCLSDPAQVIGKVLGAPMIEGQPFSKSRFATEGSGLNLASALPEGKRAVALCLTDYSGLEGLLYPGSIVDVLVSFKPSSGKVEAVSTVLLERVQVLAVESRTVFSPDSAENTSSSTRGQRRRVTVLVTPEQAQQLQLATGYGSVSLAMRNPVDRTRVTADPVALDDLRGISHKPLAAAPDEATEVDSPPEPAAPAPPEAQADTSSAKASEDAASVRSWQMEIIRGAAREMRSFPLAGDGPETSSRGTEDS